MSEWVVTERDYALAAYDYELPPACIAQQPLARRDDSRLLLVDRESGRTRDGQFREILDYLQPQDLLVVNDTKVFPARLQGYKETGGRVELLILQYPGLGIAAAPAGGEAVVIGLVRSAKRPRPGSRLLFSEQLTGEVEEIFADGKVQVRLRFPIALDTLLARHGQLPLPPYIRREEGAGAADRERYQTVFARHAGAVAAPTAGLHFTPEFLAAIRAKGVGMAAVTLHVGYGTFAPVRTPDIRDHRIHGEYLVVSEETAHLVNATKAAGGKIWAVGTTSVRALEFAAGPGGRLVPRTGVCELFIYPGYRFQVVDNLITNFHLPQSSLLFLVSALLGRERLFAAYRHAIGAGYRFYSYGDAMAVTG